MGLFYSTFLSLDLGLVVVHVLLEAKQIEGEDFSPLLIDLLNHCLCLLVALHDEEGVSPVDFQRPDGLVLLLYGRLQFLQLLAGLEEILFELERAAHSFEVLSEFLGRHLREQVPLVLLQQQKGSQILLLEIFQVLLLGDFFSIYFELIDIGTGEAPLEVHLETLLLNHYFHCHTLVLGVGIGNAVEREEVQVEEEVFAETKGGCL